MSREAVGFRLPPENYVAHGVLTAMNSESPVMVVRAREFSSLSTVERALSLLEFVSVTGRRSLSEVALFTELPRSTLLRLIGTLVEQGYLERVCHGQYSIGMKMWRIGCTAIDMQRIRDSLIPVLTHLAEETGGTAIYAVYDNAECFPPPK